MPAFSDPIEIFLTPKYTSLTIGPRSNPQDPIPWTTLVSINPEFLFESCLFRGVFSGVAGFGLGLLMGGFFHTMQPVDMTKLEGLSTLQQLRQSYSGFGASCLRSARGFAKVGLVYSAVECTIERERGVQDITNAVYSGCVTGAVLAVQAGPQAMGFGCLGFAAFSAIIEKVMHSS
jgi:import inner membrane translocase subunit TIM22